MPPISVLFFVLSGMRLNLPALQTAGIIGVAYFLVRIVGKFLGSYLGSRMTGAPREVRRYMGLALIPQAGVSIGLAVLSQRILPEASGMLLSTIILSSSVLYEMIGPVCARKALFLSGAIRTDEASGRPAVRESGAMKTANKKVPVKGNEKGNGKKEAAPKKEKAEEKPSPDLTGEKLDPKPHWAGTSGRLWAVRREKDASKRSVD